ncbi:hypothetical protein P7H17_27100, partial [Paenibacillus larvae]
TKDVTVDLIRKTPTDKIIEPDCKVTVPFFDLDRLAEKMASTQPMSLQGRSKRQEKDRGNDIHRFSLSSIAKPLVIKPIDPCFG